MGDNDVTLHDVPCPKCGAIMVWDDTPLEPCNECRLRLPPTPAEVAAKDAEIARLRARVAELEGKLDAAYKRGVEDAVEWCSFEAEWSRLSMVAAHDADDQVEFERHLHRQNVLDGAARNIRALAAEKGES